MPSQSGRAKGLMVVVVAAIVVVVEAVGPTVVTTSIGVDTAGKRVVLGAAWPPFGPEHPANAASAITRTTRRTLKTLTVKMRLPTAPGRCSASFNQPTSVLSFATCQPGHPPGRDPGGDGCPQPRRKRSLSRTRSGRSWLRSVTRCDRLLDVKPTMFGDWSSLFSPFSSLSHF